MQIQEEIEDVIKQLNKRLDVYVGYKYDSRNASRKEDRKRALSNQLTEGEIILSYLKSHKNVFDLIIDKNPFQFEDFYKKADSDIPRIIDKLKRYVDELNEGKESI